MKTYLFAVLLCAILIPGCTQNKTQPDTDRVKEDIRKAEKAFEQMAAEKGIAEAFWFFADSSAVIKRANDTLITGKEAIRNFYNAPYYQTAKVSWSPSHIDVSADGSMGYTYGSYTWVAPGKEGKPDSARGVFHTVWKKQADGNWRYVWD